MSWFHVFVEAKGSFLQGGAVGLCGNRYVRATSPEEAKRKALRVTSQTIGNREIGFATELIALSCNEIGFWSWLNGVRQNGSFIFYAEE